MKFDTPDISVIMPVYNAGKYLRQCLDSVLNQSFKNIELICIDDGSSDDSMDILKEYSKKDNRLIILSQPNKGAGAARNYGISVAKGRYYSFLDSDDFFHPDMLKTAFATAEKYSAQITVFESEKFYTKTGRYAPNYALRYHLMPDKPVFSRQEIEKDIFRAFIGWAWDKLFLADFIKQNGLLFQQQRTTNDMFFVFAAIAKAERISVIKKVLVYYRRDEGSLSVTREKSWHCFYDALTALKTQLTRWGLYTRYRQDYINYCLHFSLWNLRTLKQPTHSLLYNKLRAEWFAAMGVTSHSKTYFYNPAEYHQMQTITCCEYGAQTDTAHKIKGKILSLLDNITTTFHIFRFYGIKYTAKLIAEKLTQR